MKRPLNIIILGASSGIGREMARIFAGGGCKVAPSGRRKALLASLTEEFPNAIIPVELDVDQIEELPRRLEELASTMGRVDLLVISAGCGFLNPSLDGELELAAVSTNVSAFTVAAAWAYGFFKQKGGGNIAAITSVGGLIGEPGAPAYSASKAYQIIYLEGLAKRAKKEKSGIVVTELRPGSVDTEMMKGEGHFWIASPVKAAQMACKAILAGKRLQYISRRWSLIGFILRCRVLFT